MAVRKKADFEKQMARLQEIVTALEASHSTMSGTISGSASGHNSGSSLSLEKSVALYKEGLQLAREARAQLDTARNEVRLVTEDGLASFTEKGLALVTEKGLTPFAETE